VGKNTFQELHHAAFLYQVFDYSYQLIYYHDKSIKHPAKIPKLTWRDNGKHFGYVNPQLG